MANESVLIKYMVKQSFTCIGGIAGNSTIYIGNAPKLRVIDFLIDNMPFDYSKKEIIEGSGISKTTFFKIWKDFIKYGIVTPTRKYGKTQLFTINRENTLVKQLSSLEFALANEHAEKMVKPVSRMPYKKQKIRA